MNFNAIPHTYRVIRHCDGEEKTVFESTNYAEAEYQYNVICARCDDWTYAWYELA